MVIHSLHMQASGVPQVVTSFCSGIIVSEFVRKIGRVSDGNGVDGDDDSDGNGVILEVAHVGIGSACGSYMVLVVVYKRDGKGSDVSDPSKIERVFWIPSLRS